MERVRSTGMPEPPETRYEGKRPRLLFLAYFFPPGRSVASIRSFNVAKWLARSGWDVHVVTPALTVWRRIESPDETDRALQREGIRCLRTPHSWRSLVPRHAVSSFERGGWLRSRIGDHLARWARRAARRFSIPKEIGWLRPAERACAPFQPGDVDLVLATGGPFAAFGLARRLSKRLACPYVLDYRDLWSDNPYAGRPEARTVATERGLLASCASAIAVSPGMAKALQSRFGVGAKVRVIPNGYDAEALSEVAPECFGHFAIVYAGRFYPPKRVVTPLMAALSRLKGRDLSPPGWVFHYYGRHGDHVREAALRFDVEDRVVLHGEVPRREALAAIRGAGMAVVITSVAREATLEESGVITGKIFEAVGLRTPILAIAPAGSDLETVLATAGLGRRFSADQIEQITSYLAEAIQGRRPPPNHPEVFDWSRTGKMFDRLLRAVVEVAGGATPDGGSSASSPSLPFSGTWTDPKAMSELPPIGS